MKTIRQLAVFVLLSLPAFAQGVAGLPRVTLQNSGTAVGTKTGLITLNFTAGCTASFATGVFGISCTGSGSPTFTGVTSATYSTSSNCAVNSASPAACGSAAAGAVVIPTTTTTYTINTSAVTANSRIQLTWLSFASNLPSTPTCVAPAITSEPTISAISAGVSFTITLASTTGQTCPMFQIIN